MGLYVYVPTLTPYVAKLGGSDALVGFVVACYGIPQLTMRIGLGLWADRIGRQRPFMLAAFLLVVMSSLGMAWVASPAWVAVFRLIAGMAASNWAMFSIAYLGLNAHSHHPQAMGWVTFANNAGQVVAALLGGFLVAQYGWVSPFQASVVLALLGFGLVLAQPEPPGPIPPRNTPKSNLMDWLELLRSPWLRRASLLGALVQAATFVTTYGYVPLLAVRFGLARGDLGILMACGMVPTILMSVVSGSWWSRKMDSSILLGIGFGLAFVAIVLTPLLGRNLLALFVLQAFLGAARGIIAPLLMAWSIRAIPVQRRTTAMATYQSLYAVGMILGPVMAGAAVSLWGLDASFWMAGAFGVIGGIASASVALGLVQTAASADTSVD
jgi:MFS family permease